MFSSVITLTLTLIQLYKDYRYDLSVIDSRFVQIEVSNLATINDSLWTLNKSSLNLQLGGLLRLPDISFLEVRTPDDKIFASAGVYRAKNTIIREYPLNYSYRNSKVALGKLITVATLDNVYQRLWDTAIVILITQAIKTFLVSLFIVIIFQTLVTRHLGKLAEYLKRLNIKAPFKPYAIDRKESTFTRKDELDQLVSSFNVMHKNLHLAYTDLALNQDILKTAQSMAHVGSWMWDKETDHIEISSSLGEIVGYMPDSPEIDSYKKLIAFIHPEDRAQVLDKIKNASQVMQPVEGIHRIIQLDGSVRHVKYQLQQWKNERDNKWLLVCTWHDITEDTLQKQRLEILANYDSLTGLPNRAMFNAELRKTISENKNFIMVLLDLDGFKDINDTIGHISGDLLLKEINPRLSILLSAEDFLARLGGDEFALILRSPKDAIAGIEMVEKIRRAISTPLDLEELQIQVEVSAGVAYFPEHTQDASSLMRYADVAMYQAKKQHTGYQIYNPATDLHSPRKLALISDIRRAIKNNELTLHYQPKIDVRTRQVTGLEALARWEHPNHGFVLPADFIPYVERTELIRTFTLWAIEFALTHQSQLENAGHKLVVSVNVSARNLKDQGFATSVADILQRQKIPAKQLMLEITESAIMEDRKAVMKTIFELAESGVSLSIDDFGTGYSSLAYLKLLPVKELKIDRSFVTDMLVDDNDAIIVKSTIDLAHNLGLQVTAEGVETTEMLKRLGHYHCDVAQGYLIAKPMPFSDLLNWIEKWV